MGPELSHLDAHGHAFMVDVTGKELTERHAYVRCVLRGVANTVALLGGPDEEGPELATGPTGSSAAWEPTGGQAPPSGRRIDSAALEEARLAGLGGAKRTSELIPLCHPLPLSELEIAFHLQPTSIEVLALAATFGQTGVEMEALTACALAAVSLLGCAREHDPLASVEELTLWEKRGGRSGHWRRAEGGELEQRPAGEDDPPPR